MPEQLYQMDDATFSHLTAWCERECREDEKDTVRDRILLFLETESVQDAEWHLSHGWQHLHDVTR